MTKPPAGQRAMIAAKLFPEPEKQGHGKKGLAAERFPMVHKGSLSLARAVLAYSLELAEAVRTVSPH